MREKRQLNQFKTTIRTGQGRVITKHSAGESIRAVHEEIVRDMRDKKVTYKLIKTEEC